jgi:hypothetical protein
VEFYPIKDSVLSYDYSLDESDANKRNSLIRQLVRKDVAKGYTLAAVISSFRRLGNLAIRLRLT